MNQNSKCKTTDNREDILICMSAAVAANCIPCFEHFYEKAQGVGLADGDIQHAIDLASKVKNGANLSLRNAISEFFNLDRRQDGDETCACRAEG